MQADPSQFLLFSGSSNPALAKEIAEYLSIQLSPVELKTFPDGEISVQILESVRGRDVFVVQSIARRPNHYLMELLLLIDALKRASARSVVAVITYYGYCRQDRKDKPRVPITAKLVANLIVCAGATRVLTMDLHAGQLQGFFDIPVDNLHAQPTLEKAFKKLYTGQVVVTAPDIGSIKLAKIYANDLKCDFAVIDKHRVSPEQVAVVNVIGDVQGKDVLLADDMCSTAETLLSAAKACQGKGARKIYAAVAHGIFSDGAIEKIDQSPIEALFVTNTIPPNEAVTRSGKIRVVSVAPLFGQAIRCIVSQESIATLDD